MLELQKPKVAAAVATSPAQADGCLTLRVVKGPTQNHRGWPVRDTLEPAASTCHIDAGAQANLLCRYKDHTVCVEGPDSESAARCTGYIHTDAFVSAGTLPAKLSKIPRCDDACPPVNACRALAGP